MIGKQVVIVLLSILYISSAGCASVPIKPTGEGLVFMRPMEVVQKVGIDALVVHGFDIKKTTPDYIEGYRPRRWGFFAGSGGETVGIWLTSVDAAVTRVHIDTARTFFGGAGQKVWTDDIFAEMKKSLSINN